MPPSCVSTICTNNSVARSLCDSRASCDTVPECDRHTHTDTQTDTRRRHSITSRGKNWAKIGISQIEHASCANNRQVDGELFKNSSQFIKQKAMLLQRDRVTRLSVEILQLRIIPFEKDCNRQMTLKYIHPRSSQLLLLDRPYITL